jgi:S-layer protein (TIGR01567 family)
MNKCIKYVSILIILMAFAATAMADTPSIISWSNNVTNDNSTSITVDEFKVIQFNATADQTGVTWNWFKDGNLQTGATSDTFETDWDADGESHNVEVKAKNASDASTPIIWELTVNETRPAKVTGLTNNTPTTITVKLSWNSNSESDVIEYKVYQDGSPLVTTTNTYYDVTGLLANNTYEFNVSAYDNKGFSSENASIPVTTAAAGPTGTLTITEVKNTTTSSSATITWTTNNDSDSRVKYGTTSGDYEKKKHDATNETDHSITLTDLDADTTYYFRVNSTDESGNSAESGEYEFKTKAEGHSTGFRIWDADRDPPMDLNYTWTARSYTGFYYDIDDNVSTETLTVKLDDYDDRTIDEDDLKYITTADDIEFEYGEWGTYKVIGFMAEKYFAGYEKGEAHIADENIRLLSKDMLSKVLIDEDEKHTISTGASLELKEGYELKIIQLDIDGGQAQLELMKDGRSVDTDIVTSPDDYVYTEDLGKLDDVPLVVVHIDSVFAGTESDMVVIEGIFQISDDTIPVDTGEEYDDMEIKSASSYTIEMRNMDDIDLEEDEIVDIMGNLKFLVADNDTLRFALYEEITEPGTHDIRGTVYDTNEPPTTWDHMNFEGFYYNIHDDLGTETLEVKECSGNTIAEDGLVYTTTAQLVEFDFDDWGSFKVVGFMAESYFAGYEKGVTDGDITNDDINLLSKDMLSKVLIDVEDDRMISTGASLQLEEGYELKVIQLDIDGGQAQIELLKNGRSVDTEIVESPDTYVYTEDLGKLDDVPLVVVYIGNVFAGTESDLVTIEGVFQISDDPISVDSGDEYGEMEITSASGDKITMKNKENEIDLEDGESVMIMENIGFTTSDDGGDRYYLFVRRTIGSIAALKIELPESLVVGEEIVITITADGSPVEGAQVQFAGENLGLTDSDGKVTITSEEAGTFTIIASKENYDSASEDIRILTEAEAEKDPLKIEMPDKVEPEEDVVIKVTYKGDAIEGASVSWDGDYIGDTDETGSLTYTAEDEGTYTVTANKGGYLEGSEEIEVAYPSAEFELADLTFPENVSANKEFTVSVDVTNTGDANGTYLAELKVNDTVVDSQNVTLDAGDTEKIEFTTKIAEAGTTTIEIGTESGEITVTKAKSNTALIAAVLIVLALLGAIGYMLISSAPEGGWTVEKLSDAIKDKFQRGGKGL